MVREIVLVSGAPGSGKSTLARHLARILGMDLISKDLITESLWEVFDSPTGDLERLHQLEAAAMEVVWTLAGQSRRAVVDATFHPHSDSEKIRLSGLSAKLVEVYCSCPPEVALKRCARRATQPGIHPAHATPILDPAIIDQFDKPIGLGSVVEVDTTQVIGIEELAKVIAADLTEPVDLPDLVDHTDLVGLQSKVG